MVRKNISIGVDTWEGLAALGKFGQTFDDIIKILLQEHHTCPQHRRQQQVGQALGASTDRASQLKEFVAEAMEPHQQKGGIVFNIPGIESRFPISKEGLIQYIGKLGNYDKYSFELLIATKLPDTKNKYKNKSELEEELFTAFVECNRLGLIKQPDLPTKMEIKGITINSKQQQQQIKGREKEFPVKT
jgi:hypothetical protein